VFEHPRNPYVPVDAPRSTRPVRVEFDGVVLVYRGDRGVHHQSVVSA